MPEECQLSTSLLKLATFIREPRLAAEQCEARGGSGTVLFSGYFTGDLVQ